MVGFVPERYQDQNTARSGLKMRDIVYVLFRRRWIILAIVVPLTLVGGLSIFSKTGHFTATANVLVQLSKVDLPRWNISGRNIDYDRELSTLYNMAMSVPVASRAAASLQDSISVITELDPNLASLNTTTGLQEFLLSSLDVSVVGESSILVFSFDSANPRISLMAVGALRDAFVDYEVHGLKNPHAVAYYSEQLATVRAEIDSLLAARGQVMAEHGYISFVDDIKYKSGQLADIKNQIVKATTDRHTLEVEYKTLVSYLNRDPREFPMGADENRAITLVYWRNMVSKHEDELNSILTIHTDGSVPAKRQRSLLSKSIERLRKEETAYTQSIAMALTSATARVNSLRNALEEMQRQESQAPAIYQEISLLDAEITSLRDLLKNLQGKLGEVRLAQMADERVSSVEAINVPELAVILSGGKTMIYFIMLLFIGIATGVVVAFIVDSFDHRIYSPRDVEENLQLPILASVSKVE